jgi:hypothetical protein
MTCVTRNSHRDSLSTQVLVLYQINVFSIHRGDLKKWDKQSLLPQSLSWSFSWLQMTQMTTCLIHGHDQSHYVQQQLVFQHKKGALQVSFGVSTTLFSMHNVLLVACHGLLLHKSIPTMQILEDNHHESLSFVCSHALVSLLDRRTNVARPGRLHWGRAKCTQ